MITRFNIYIYILIINNIFHIFQIKKAIKNNNFENKHFICLLMNFAEFIQRANEFRK